MSTPGSFELRGKRPCLRRQVSLSAGESGIWIDASQMTWASPVDLTSLIAIAHWASPGPVTVVFPQDRDVSGYLARMGVLDALVTSGATVGNAPDAVEVQHDLVDRLIEVRHFPTSRESDLFASDVFSLVSRNVDHASAHLLHRLLGELLCNVFQHAHSAVGAWGAAQVHSGVTSGRRGVEVAVSDIGIGVLQSLRQNAAFAELDACDDALQAALRKGVSAKSADDPFRGAGLSRVTQQLHQHGGFLVLRSGDGVARVTRADRSFARTRAAIPGTWAWLWVDLGSDRAP